MLSIPTDTNEIMVLGTSFVLMLHGKSKISSISLPQSKFSQIFESCHYIKIAKTGKKAKRCNFKGAEKQK